MLVYLAAQDQGEFDGPSYELIPFQFRLATGNVEVLARNPGKLVSQRQVLEDVWGPGHADDTAYLRVHMAHIRRKLEPEPSRPRYFLTEPGMGYRFEGAA